MAICCIIWGEREYLSFEENSPAMNCPKCHAQGSFRAAVSRRKFHLYFIPLFNVREPVSLLACRRCNCRFIPVAPLPRLAAPVAAAVQLPPHTAPAASAAGEGQEEEDVAPAKGAADEELQGLDDANTPLLPKTPRR